MDLEKVKDKALDLGKKAAGAALDFVEKAAEATLKRYLKGFQTRAALSA